jgi:phenylacetic acid degradation protein paaN
VPRPQVWGDRVTTLAPVRLDRALVDAAVDAVARRTGFTGYPGGADRSDDARALAAAALKARRGTTMALSTAADQVIGSMEFSPFTRQTLGVDYASPSVPDAVALAHGALGALTAAGPELRTAICVETLKRLYDRRAELAAVTMHTTGQSLAMAENGSGINALDRGLEAVALSYAAMSRVPTQARWTEAGSGDPTGALIKRYSLVPRGVALVICCASFPAWNAYPAILANIATGNPVLVKPHPTSVLGAAIAVETLRAVLVDAGLPSDAAQLILDTPGSPVAKEVIAQPQVSIVDFTGSPAFGRWLEVNCPGALVFTETAGANSVVVDSVDDLAKVSRVLATSLSLFSGQMCTTPQNLHIPQNGIDTASGHVSYDEVVASIVAALDDIASIGKRAAAICGAVQADSTVALAQRTRDAVEQAGGRILRAATPYDHPDFPQARTLTPLIAEPDAHDPTAREEVFGPVAFVLPARDTAAAIARATADVRASGAISSYLFSRNETVIDQACDAFVHVGASLSINVTGPMPMQYSAAFSDYHVTGLNPAGTATVSDESFIAGRFRIVQNRRPG